MGSFKLEKGKTKNREVMQAGFLIMVLSLPVILIFSFLWGGLLLLFGLVLAIGGKLASD